MIEVEQIQIVTINDDVYALALLGSSTLKEAYSFFKTYEYKSFGNNNTYIVNRIFMNICYDTFGGIQWKSKCFTSN